MLTKSNSTKQQRQQLAKTQLLAKLSRETISLRRPQTISGRRKRKPRQQPATLFTRNATRRIVARPGPSLLRHPYTMCRLMPFTTQGRNQGIPDGSSTRRLLMDHRITTTITFGSSGATGIYITPCIPSPVWVFPVDTTTLINGVTYAFNSVSNFMIPQPIREWDNNVLTYNNSSEIYNEVQALHAASKFRIVTCGWSLSYIGTDLTNSGVIVINQSDITLEPPVPNASANFVVPSSTSATNTTFSQNQIYLRSYNGLPPNAIPGGQAGSEDTRVIPLKDGCHGILRHSGPTYEYEPLSGFMTYIATPNAQNNSLLMNTIPTPATVKDSGVVQGFDNSWSSSVIFISGATTGQSIILDLVLCVEYVPQASSQVYSMAKQSPPENQRVMKLTDNLVKKLPVANEGSALKTAVDVASLVGSMATLMA
jgi:hypothetical protein